MRIVNAEKRLLLHIQMGGGVTDVVGRQLVSEFISTALKVPEIAQIAEDYSLSAESLEILYATGIQRLLPNPCICDGGPVQIPNRVGFLFAATLFFMEPDRLRGMAREIAARVAARGPITIEFTTDAGELVREEFEGTDIARIEAIGEVATRDAKLVRQIHDQRFGPAKFTIEQGVGLKSTKGCIVLLFGTLTFGTALGYVILA